MYIKDLNILVTLQTLTFVEGSLSNRRAHTELCHRNPETLERAWHRSRGIFRTLIYSKPETYSEHCQITTMVCFAKIVNSDNYFRKLWLFSQYQLFTFSTLWNDLKEAKLLIFTLTRTTQLRRKNLTYWTLASFCFRRAYIAPLNQSLGVRWRARAIAHFKRPFLMLMKNYPKQDPHLNSFPLEPFF